MNAKTSSYKSAPPIQFRNVTYRINGIDHHNIVNEINFAVTSGETLVLLGRSGSGKTTLLRLINRLLTPTDGQVLVGARLTTEWDPIRLRRGIGYVIQDAGLFPHFTVAENVALVPTLEKWDSARIDARVNELLPRLGLAPADFASRRPHELPGGQRQRVGVARALAADPAILLMDEPFGALDAITRDQLQREFLLLQQRLGKTVVFVTHDLREALLLGSRVALMEAGKLVTVLSPKDFLRSTDPFAAAYARVLGGG